MLFSRKNRLNVLTWLTLSLSSNTVMANYSDDIVDSEKYLRDFIRFLRIGIRNTGSAEIKRIDETVHFVVDDSPIPNASAGKNARSGRNEIRISPSYKLLVTYIADVYTFSENNPKFSGCHLDYQRYIFNSLANNRVKLSQGQGWTR